jgi:CBS domain-containing protein
MNVSEIMSADFASCTPATTLRDVAVMMVERDCGEIPVCDELGKPVGVVTDRDIVCRVVAKGRNPLEANAADCMSSVVITTTPETLVDDCARLMEQYQVRRLPVVDQDGSCCGMIAQSDLARKGPRETAAEVVQKVSEPNTFASSVGGR